MYVAVKGGERAIANAHALLAEKRRGDTGVPAIGIDQIDGQLALAVDRVMTEGSLCDRKLAALASTLKPPAVHGGEDGDLLLVGWGSTLGAIEEAVDRARAEGLAV